MTIFAISECGRFYVMKVKSCSCVSSELFFLGLLKSDTRSMQSSSALRERVVGRFLLYILFFRRQLWSLTSRSFVHRFFLIFRSYKMSCDVVVSYFTWWESPHGFVTVLLVKFIDTFCQMGLAKTMAPCKSKTFIYKGAIILRGSLFFT